MAHPKSSSENPFIIPSLIPPLVSSGQRQDSDVSKGNNKSIVYQSPSVRDTNSQSQRLRRPLHTKEMKRKVLSPIENFSSASNRNSSHKKSSRASFTKSPSLASFTKSPSFASPLPSASNMSSSTGKHKRNSQKIVALFGETMESFFGSSKQESTKEPHQLHDSIINGSRTDDPGTWCRVLEVARAQYRAAQNVDNCNNKSKKENLIRLHRLATLRFSLDRRGLPTSSTTSNHQKQIFEIWLSYAKIHAEVGNVDEARRTFRCIEENEKVLLDFSASPGEEEERGSASLFFLEYAGFEMNHGGNKNKARNILLRGIKEKAEPILELEKALTSLNCSDDCCDEVTRRYRKNGTQEPENSQDVLLRSSRLDANRSLVESNTGTSQLKRERLAGDVSLKSEKRLKLSEMEMIAHHTVEKNNAFVEKGGTGVNNTSNIQNKATIESSPKISTESKNSVKSFRIYREASALPTTTSNRSTCQRKSLVTKNRPTLTSRLARKGLTGKAKRVNCSITVDDDHDSSSDDETHQDGATSTQLTEDLSSPNEATLPSTSSKAQTGKSSKVPSFKKLDLSYMWAWDPSKKGKSQNETINDNQPTEKSSDGTSSTGSGQSTSNTQITVIDTQGSDSSGGISSSKKVKQSVETKERQKGDQIPESSRPTKAQSSKGKENENVGAVKMKTLGTDQKKVEGENMNSSGQVDESTMSKRQALVAKANLEFLPLVHEDNIIRVKNSTYAKLGVIGKGGSCKVYRALSKKCSVVAIKKVKLAGMDRKAIEGYANEISLLKRLRGNPAIIQMYDSEVDIQRKSIFVVMELGEVDLNHVLQQRALSKTSRSLNMNFIRLTWQQMLSAVHCIHEERIIHSDLKPANFLFVRGALKLIDFGIAKAIVNDDTTNIYRENHIGTLNYMSPEAILDTGSGQDGPRMRIGRASDVWSLGCILYEMVYGKTPFYKLHFIQKLQAIVNPSHKIHFSDDDEAEAAIDAMKLCLRRNPEERPPIIGENGLLNEHWFLHAKRRPR